MNNCVLRNVHAGELGAAADDLLCRWWTHAGRVRVVSEDRTRRKYAISRRCPAGAEFESWRVGSWQRAGAQSGRQVSAARLV